MKFFRKSPDVLYVPFYMRSFSVYEKIIIASSFFISSMIVSSIPLVVAAISTTETPEQTITTTYNGETE